jgi:hypothetical protein
MPLNLNIMLNPIHVASIISQYPWEVLQGLCNLKGSMFASSEECSVHKR